MTIIKFINNSRACRPVSVGIVPYERRQPKCGSESVPTLTLPTKTLTTFLLADNSLMNDPKLKRATGNWVVGDQFWDRETELALFIERLSEGAHLLLTAPRRIGKTSWMKEAARRLDDHFLCLYIDLQKAESASDAIVELSLAAHSYRPAWDRMASVFQNALKDTIDTVKLKDLSISLRSGLTPDNWRRKSDQLLDILSEQDRPVVLFLDEVAILVNRILRGSDYVITPQRKEEAESPSPSGWGQGDAPPRARIRFVVTGSIGLEPLVRQAGLSATLNTFTPFHLEPWSREVAASCLVALSNGYSLTIGQDAIKEMLDCLGLYIPHHVQMFFDHAYQEARLAGVSELSPAMVRTVYKSSMLGIRGHVELSHMEERLRMVLGPRLDVLALDLLTEAAVVGSLTSDAVRVLASAHFGDDWATPARDVLGILEHDGYLNCLEAVYSFASALLKDWWQARFQFAYVPAAARRQ